VVFERVGSVGDSPFLVKDMAAMSHGGRKGHTLAVVESSGHLDPERNEKQRLEEALELNADLSKAYYLKEDLRELWNQPNRTQGRNFLSSWYLRAQASGVRVLQQFARTMQRQAYGYRDDEFFKLKLYALHESKFKLVG
jgi:hypothetical protein